MTAGSIAGAGTYNLGSKQLTVGSNSFNTRTVSGLIEGVGGSLIKVGTGTLTIDGAGTYTGGTTVSGGALVVGDFANPTAALSGGGPISVGSAGTLGGYGSVTGDVTNSGVIAPGSASRLSGSPMGAFTINGNYTGAGGTMAINTVLGGSGSPSDLLVLSGGAATGNTIVHVTNVGGVGAETTGNGIQVVEAVNGATTSPGAFALPAGELRAGAFDYDLFRGGLGASNRQDWFLRSDFVGGGGGGGGGVPLPIPPFPIDPPPNPLPPNVLFPIIGPELATYGVVQPLARQLGLSILGTLDDRVGDTYEPDGCGVAPAVAPNALPTRKPGPAPAPCPLFSPSVWGRFFGLFVVVGRASPALPQSGFSRRRAWLRLISNRLRGRSARRRNTTLGGSSYRTRSSRAGLADDAKLSARRRSRGPVGQHAELEDVELALVEAHRRVRARRSSRDPRPGRRS